MAKSGVQVAYRGLLAQTLVAVLDAFDKPDWISVTLEPNVDSEKVDILWKYADRATAVQVKSTEGVFTKSDVERWAADLAASKQADDYELVLVGTPTSGAVPKDRLIGRVSVPPPLPLNLQALHKQAAFGVTRFLEAHRLPAQDARTLLDVVSLLTEKLFASAPTGRALTRAGLVRWLQGWLVPRREGLRVIRVFVSAPEDVTLERKVVEEVVERINRFDGEPRGLRFEVQTWSGTPVPPNPLPSAVPAEREISLDEIYVGILCQRFAPDNARKGSGTEAEFTAALQRWSALGSPWLRVYVHSLRVDLDSVDLDEYARVRTFQKSIPCAELVTKYQSVRDSRESFREKVEEHLREALGLLAPVRGTARAKPADPTAYLRDLLEATAYLDIRGLATGKPQANRFPIEDLYMSLTISVAADELEGSAGRRASGSDEAGVLGQQRREQPLHAALQHDRLLVIGDPGAGKTTFLRRVAHVLCETQLGIAPDAAPQRLQLAACTFPILIRLSELAQHVLGHAGQTSAPQAADAPAWLPHYLGAVSKENEWGLDADFFRRQLEGGDCIVMLDGLDEAPDRQARENLARLLERTAAKYRQCRLVVTSRPAALTLEAVPPGFAQAHIEPLSDQAVATFLSRWCGKLYLDSEAAAGAHCDELLAALRARPNIRRLARNPVMLTALAVVHWNERRLPEQRAELYESIIRWLSRSRQQRAEREKADRTVVLLQELALAMQQHPAGMRTQVPKRWASEALAGEFASAAVDRDALASAEQFLAAEELDSGIIVARGSDVQFWHRTFQEFLAARAIAAWPDEHQQELLWGPPPRLYLLEWREVMLLLAGILYQQGRPKVDKLLESMIQRLGDAPPLADEARCAGLLGGMLRDLAPVDYEPPGHEYRQLLRRVLAVFEPEGSQAVPLEIRIAAADALGQAGDPRLDPHRGDYWIPIPAGKFLMGAQNEDPQKPNYDELSTDTDQWRETPHEVYVDAYQIARYPLTVDQYQQFIQDEGYLDRQWWSAGGFGTVSEPEGWEKQRDCPSRPVVGVSWFEASAYCAWAGCRLPREAEWERAARGTTGRKYPWGDEAADEQRLNFANKVGHPTPVGIYPLGNTPEGVCDLAGNVWEWCVDGFEEYTAEPVSNPCEPRDATRRVVRGGSWGNYARLCRSASRFGFAPVDRSYYLGFRVAAVPLASSRNQQPGQAEPGA